MKLELLYKLRKKLVTYKSEKVKLFFFSATSLNIYICSVLSLNSTGKACILLVTLLLPQDGSESVPYGGWGRPLIDCCSVTLLMGASSVFFLCSLCGLGNVGGTNVPKIHS